MEENQSPYSKPFNPARQRLVRTNPRKPISQMSHIERISKAVAEGMLPRDYAENVLGSKDAGTVYNSPELRGLGTALLMGDKRWRPGTGVTPGTTSVPQEARPQTKGMRSVTDQG